MSYQPANTNSGLPAIGRPATSALQQVGASSLSEVAELTRREVAALHGVGPKALRVLDEALRAAGLAFKE